MKFSDGYWHMREGVTARYPMQVRDFDAADDRLTVYAPTKRIVTRGDTLNLPLLTVTCTAPAPEVIAVRVSRHVGGRPLLPEFQVERDPGANPKVTRDDSTVTFSSGALSAR